MAVTLLMLPPQTETTRDWARRLASVLPELSVVVAEDVGAAARAGLDVFEQALRNAVDKSSWS